MDNNTVPIIIEEIDVSSSLNYLEAMNDLKDKYDEFREKEMIYKCKILSMKKDICSLYGLLRVMDNISSYDGDIPRELSDLLDLTRVVASESFTEHIIR
tara:strand:+ start:337 stop:633 length:297 start_codon:yes stop_codon:yes gene_type:complete